MPTTNQLVRKGRRTLDATGVDGRHKSCSKYGTKKPKK